MTQRDPFAESGGGYGVGSAWAQKTFNRLNFTKSGNVGFVLLYVHESNNFV